MPLNIRHLDKPVYVAAAANPFELSRIETVVSEGLTVEDIITTVQPDPALRRFAYVEIDGWGIEPDKWHVVRPRSGRLVTVRIVPGIGGSSGGGGSEGGGGSNKSTFRLVATIAVLVAAAIAAPYLAPFLGAVGITGAFATTLAFAAISGVGMLAVNAIAPIRPGTSPVASISPGGGSAATLKGASQSDSPTNFLEGARNAANLFGPVPVLLGTHKMVPPLGARTFTEVVGSGQYLRMLVVWGYGRINIGSTLKIGATPIANFTDYQVVTRQGTAGDPALTLVPSDVEQEDFSLFLTTLGAYSQRTTLQDCDELSIDITLPRGLIEYLDDGSRSGYTVVIGVRYRKVGQVTWQQAVFTANTDVQGNISYATPNVTTVTMGHATNAAIKHGFRWSSGERASYEVAVARLNVDSTSDRVIDDVYWTSLRAIKNDPPIDFPHNLATTEFIIKATDQLDRAIDELNAVGSLLALDWNGSSWVEQATNNPASLFRYVLQGDAKATPVADSKIDLVALQEWHAFCATNGFTFNQYRDFSSSVWSTLQDICSAGRAQPTMTTGKWSVIIDQERAIPTQHITPRNSREFKYEKAWAPVPHAWRMRFINEEADYRADERIVPAVGYTEETASDFQALEAPGVTNPEQLYKIGRFAHRAIRLRPERYTVMMDFEHIVCRKGDLVLVTHDVLAVGLASGRIKEVLTSGSNITGFVLDEPVTMASALLSYGIVVRTVNEVGISLPLVRPDADEHATVTLTTPLAIEVDPDDNPQVGDLFGFGELGIESIKCLVLGFVAASELEAKIVLIPYSGEAGEMYDEEGTTPPVFATHLSTVPTLPAPDNFVVVTDESALIRREGETLEVRAQCSADPIDDPEAILQVQKRPSITREAFRSGEQTRIEANVVSMGQVLQSEIWDFRARWLSPKVSLTPGPWVESSNVTITGKSTPPTELRGLTLSIFGGSAYLRWDEPPELDVRYGGLVRFRRAEDSATPPDWSNSVSIGQAAKARSLFAVLPAVPGYYLARVYDASSNPSDIVYVNTKQASVLQFGNASEIDEGASFGGINSNTVVDNGILQLDPTGLFDDVVDVDELVSWDYLDGGVQVSGTYYFQFGFDFGAVVRRRITVDINALSGSVSDFIDSRLGNIDDWENFDGTEQAEGDAQIWMSQTDDDPDASPASWSTYERVDSMEVECRGLQFEARLSTLDANYSVFVTSLVIRAEEVI